jgi:hypothetical protein
MLIYFLIMEFNDFFKNGKKMLIYTYSTEHFSNKDKVRFYYALKGRDGKSGIVKELKIIHLGKTVLMVPEKFREDMEQFIRIWNIPYTIRKVIADEELIKGGSR